MSLSHVAEMSVSVLWNATPTPLPQVPPIPAADVEFELDFTSNTNNNITNDFFDVDFSYPSNASTGPVGRRPRMPPQMSSHYNFMMTMNNVHYYGDPIIFVVGFIGNIIAYLVFTRSRFRKVPSVPYLAGIAVADSGYLVTYYMVTLTTINKLPIMTQMGVCQFGSFANYAFLFLSNWYCVALVTEKFISVYWPLKKVSMCTTFRNKVVLVCFAVLAIVAYSYVIYFFGPDGNLKMCGPWQEFHIPFKTLQILDCIVVFICPLGAEIILLLLIFIKICVYMRISSNSGEFGVGGAGRVGRGRGGPVSSSSSSTQSHLVATRLIYGLITLVIATHLPNSVFRVMGFFQEGLSTDKRMAFIRSHTVVRQIHLGSFGVKFILYLLVSSAFRKHTLNLFRKTKLRVLKLFSRRKGIEANGGESRVVACCCYSGVGMEEDSEAIDPQRISLKGCGQGHAAHANDACQVQSDV